MLEAKELNKFRVTVSDTSKGDVTKYCTSMKNVKGFIEELENMSEDEFDGDSINIEKLVPMDYFPTGFTNQDAIEENLWLGQFMHFHDLPNSQDAHGTLFTRRFILLTYTNNDFDPMDREWHRYVAHMFLPKLASAGENELKFRDYLKEIGPVRINIHSTSENYDDMGVIASAAMPLDVIYDKLIAINDINTDSFIEDIMNSRIEDFASASNPFSYLKTIKRPE